MRVSATPETAKLVVRVLPLVLGHDEKWPLWGWTSLGAGVALGGFLFTLALHLQGDLGSSALVSGLLFVPSATVTTITSLNWQRLPRQWHWLLVPAGLIGTTVTNLLLSPVESGSHRNTGLLIVDLIFLGSFFGHAYSPIISLTLANVPVADAADASGVLITMVQLGQVFGVATLGTLYLTLVPHDTHAASITFIGAAGCSLVAAASGAAMVRRRY